MSLMSCSTTEDPVAGLDGLIAVEGAAALDATTGGGGGWAIALLAVSANAASSETEYRFIAWAEFIAASGLAS